MNSRILFLFSAFVLFWLLLLIKIFDISILEHKNFEDQASKNMLRQEPIIPIRGQILDRNGLPLATNTVGFSISLPPRLSLRANLPILEQETEKLLAFFPKYSKEELIKKYRQKDSPYNHEFIPVIDFVGHEEILKYYPKLSQSNTLRIVPLARRFYPNNATASHIIGYVSRANQKDIEKQPIAKYTGNIGKEGLERQYDTFLQGELGERIVKVTALNQEVGVVSHKEAIENRDLITTLDIKLQSAMDSIFSNKNGAAIIMDALNGEILAAGSYPEYNLNHFIGGISHENWNALRDNPHKPLINKFINGLYPPGSVIKMGMGLALLEYTDINENTEIKTPPFIELGGRKFRDWKKEGHESADLYKAIKRSVDVYFYLLAQRTDFENIASVLKKMGLGEKTGVDLPNEFIGIVPSPSFKKKRYKQDWFAGDSVVSSIGQGLFLTTPLQIANYTALIASGKLPTPHFVKNTQEALPKDVLNAFEKSKLPILREGMRQVCSEIGGTAFYATRESKAHLACKTGTAQVVGISQEDKARIKEEDMEYFHRSQAWITAFLPADNPRYVITIMVEHGGSGSGTGGPVLAKLSNALVDLGYVKPYKKASKSLNKNDLNFELEAE
ncbi:penicillin-binding protein 2 [Helicobacter winghamensis]|uniref:Penicillin-binding protein 2 n=1 Tax=Helicobacter winghamensis TaxID=157268 RepID=A0A2N3PHU1_9HELI|nr:penicillin-binding protein 2 [Helicobacter winghamensis]PKT78000.1 penicillin-binding protein 2 [Helicobacter winghamensis]PKT78262.1 penicillin-binding protein 2 [Helicobacter winghamensis]PKT78528.1 penicillin-binding protein 2 [Helicobacter winghamensis]PKT80143.1 penicillin-binding protein 2 [Helicobacter winghamensis]PKT80250.1 penicillin-binding protein 2 [Helicobacter winghamensis]